MLTHQAAEHIVDTYMRCLSEGDLEGIMALYADDATVEDPVGSGVLAGKAAIREFYGHTVAMDITAERTGAVRCAANEMVFPFLVHARTADMAITYEIIDHFVVDGEGRVVSMRAFWSEANIRH
ncbi:SnoaL-like domain-containing protein [Aestuariicella hydrocarbonica]|uniref:SnoaL-like domain-containing protein n=1 Tax=Pseudomaricurvus hydrocarbonicus TaxID=1470433 RepID=A0A9E5MK69_9GAMM|nr:nuclear transport factor 2 family protein [Aestuariicella hydrocarbonica]NHO66099.1 SnoaL-like domain-containing protein [Aestuariicella hydrocarbonica]